MLPLLSHVMQGSAASVMTLTAEHLPVSRKISLNVRSAETARQLPSIPGTPTALTSGVSTCAWGADATDGKSKTAPKSRFTVAGDGTPKKPDKIVILQPACTPLTSQPQCFHQAMLLPACVLSLQRPTLINLAPTFNLVCVILYCVLWRGVAWRGLVPGPLSTALLVVSLLL